MIIVRNFLGICWEFFLPKPDNSGTNQDGVPKNDYQPIRMGHLKNGPIRAQLDSVNQIGAPKGHLYATECPCEHAPGI